MNKSAIVLLLGVALITGCSKSETPKTEPKVGENPLNAPTDYLSTVAKNKKSAEATVDTASLSSAISMFQVEKGRNPKDLDELVSSGTIKALPTPPYNMKFSYDATTGAVKVVPK